MRRSLTFGMICKNAPELITVGDAKDGVKEINLNISDDGKVFGSTFMHNIPDLIGWKNCTFYKKLAKELKKEFGISPSPKRLCELWCMFNMELDGNMEDIEVVCRGDDGTEFSNMDNKYAGKIYASYFEDYEDEDGGIEEELTIILNRVK